MKGIKTMEEIMREEFEEAIASIIFNTLDVDKSWTGKDSAEVMGKGYLQKYSFSFRAGCDPVYETKTIGGGVLTNRLTGYIVWTEHITLKDMAGNETEVDDYTKIGIQHKVKELLEEYLN